MNSLLPDSYGSKMMHASLHRVVATASRPGPFGRRSRLLGSLVQGLSVLLLGLSGFAQATCPEGLPQTKPDGIYSVNADNTVTDRQTGLVWARCSLGNSASDCSGGNGTYSWIGALEAVQAANASNYLGHSDWRLPNVKELSTLVEVACYWPAINSTVFPRTSWSALGYWTSSVVSPNLIDGDAEAWTVSFGEGEVAPHYKNEVEYRYVRLVRGG